MPGNSVHAPQRAGHSRHVFAIPYQLCRALNRHDAVRCSTLSNYLLQSVIIRCGGRATTPVTLTALTAHRSPAGRLFLRLRLRNTTRHTALLTGQLRLTGCPRRTGRGPVPCPAAGNAAAGYAAAAYRSGQGRGSACSTVSRDTARVSAT